MREISRSEFLKGAAALSGLALAGGCGTPAAYQTGGKKTLDFWFFSNERRGWQENAWKLYKKEKNPDFKINFLTLPYQQMHDKILIASQAGSGGPDIADIEIGSYGRFVKGDPIFIDITPELERRNLLDKFYLPSTTDPWSAGGEIHGLGSELNTCLMCYRQDLYEKAGVKTPIETWDEFAEEAKRYHQDTGDYLIDADYLGFGDWWQMTLQQGGGFFDKDGRPIVASPEGIRTLEFMKKSVREDWAILRTTGSFNPAYYTTIAAGKVATLLGPSWNFSGLLQAFAADLEGKMRLQPFPRWEEGGSRTATTGGTGVCVLKSASLPEEAVDFVIWEHTNVEALLFDYKARQVWPSYKPAFDEKVLTEPVEFYDNQRVGEIINEVSPGINKWYNSAFWPEVTAATLRVAITPGLSTEQSPASALRDAQKESLDIIDFSTA